MPEHNKARYADLPTPLKSKLEDTTIRTFELSPKTSKNLLFIIFERLNTGGIALNEMGSATASIGGSSITLSSGLPLMNPSLSV